MAITDAMITPLLLQAAPVVREEADTLVALAVRTAEMEQKERLRTAGQDREALLVNSARTRERCMPEAEALKKGQVALVAEGAEATETPFPEQPIWEAEAAET